MPRNNRPPELLSTLLGCLLLLTAASAPPLVQAARFVGVGIAISIEHDGSVWIEQVLPGGPADRVGVRAGEELLAIDGRSVADLSPAEVPARIRGREGTTVVLTVRAEGERPQRLAMKRAMISPEAAPAKGTRESPPPPTRAPQQTETGISPPTKTAVPLKFTRYSVRDPGINNIEAVSLLVPAGWKVAGGITWLPNYSILANLLLRVTDPRSGAQIQFLPVQNFTWMTQMAVPMAPGTNYLGNILWRPMEDIPRFIHTFYLPRALRHLQGARLVSVREMPGVAAAVARAEGGPTMARSARVRYAYRHDGRPWEEDVFVTLVYTHWQMGTFWSVHSAYALRAPKDRFARLEPVMAATVNSLHLSLDWYAGYRYVQKLFENRMRQGIADAAAISATISRNSEAIRRMFSESYRKMSASQDRINRRFSEYIRGVESYRDPFREHPVELPSGYRDAWVNAGGEYLLSNDANFNPNVGSNTEWRRMRSGAGN